MITNHSSPMHVVISLLLSYLVMK